MTIELMKETKIGPKMSIGASYEGEEVAIFIASEDVSASIAFLPEEFEMFCCSLEKIRKRWEQAVRRGQPKI